MKFKPVRISAVPYINAQPFVYGIENSGYLALKKDQVSGKQATLSLDVPSVCAEKLRTNKTDIGLAPVAVIPHLKKHHIITDFCIGAHGPVRTVILYSEVPLKEIRSIYLDYQSQTSVQLIQILAKQWWKINPQWLQAKEGYEKKISGATAGLIIGDRNFSLPFKQRFAYDLSEEWKMFTGLPFVFACWISNKDIDEDFAFALYRALRFGVESRSEVIKQLKNQYDENLIYNYLNNYIHYRMDKPKKTAMELFLKLSGKIK